MCGIAGVAGFAASGLVERMLDTIRHRGPDDHGTVALNDAAMCLGMRRLSIIDLAGGHQPMSAADDRVHLVHNGEIYNYRELRTELEGLGHRFSTQSDTEVALAAYLAWGEEAWPRLRGMFALAIVDRRRHPARLLLVRDHVGIKPLYYVARGGRFAFASEIKALTCWKEWPRDVAPGAIWNYLTLRYVPGPDCLLSAVRKLQAGHQLEWCQGQLRFSQWWRPPSASIQEKDIDDHSAIERFGHAMRQSIRRHMVADVPIGLYLSSGIDSSALAALMAETGAQKLRTLSIGFADGSREEVDQAATTARLLGAEHHELQCRAEDFAGLSDIVWHLDQPIGDPIVVPTYELSRQARRDVKVVLSGVGGDELLGGYLFQRKLVSAAGLKRLVPNWLWRVGSTIFDLLPERVLDRGFDYPGRLGVEGRRKLARFIAGFGERATGDDLRRLTSQYDPEDFAALGSPLSPLLTAQAWPPMTGQGSTLQSLVEMLYRDWLPDLMLTQFDKLTMAHSVEGRVPYLDPDLIATSAGLPDRHKLRGSENKWVLRALGRDLLPTAVTEGAKRAFYMPIDRYIASPRVAELFRYALDPARLRRRGLVREDLHARLVEAPAADGFLALKRAFSVVMLELWFDRFAPEASWS